MRQCAHQPAWRMRPGSLHSLRLGPWRPHLLWSPDALREGDFVGSDASFMYVSYAVLLSLSSCKLLRVFY